MQVHLGIDIGKTGLRVGAFTADMTSADRWSFPTVDVEHAQEALHTKLLALRRAYEIVSAGLSIFGPLQVDRWRPAYGAVIESSEPAWSGVNVPHLVAGVLEREVWFDFDVNAGALAEASLGNGRGLSRFVYLSVGTGIGAVAYSGAHRPGFAPQIGHMYLPREQDDLSFEGTCRFHGGCLQGLASGNALMSRWGKPAERFGVAHAAWDLEARYLARACTNLVYVFAPEAILLGSSVGSAPALWMPDVNRYTMSMLNDFLEPELRMRYRERPAVIRAALGSECSLIGSALLGIQEVGLAYHC